MRLVLAIDVDTINDNLHQSDGKMNDDQNVRNDVETTVAHAAGLQLYNSMPKEEEIGMTNAKRIIRGKCPRRTKP